VFWVDAWTNILTAALSAYVAVQLMRRVNMLGSGINDYAERLENSAAVIAQISEGRRAEAELRALQAQYTSELEQRKTELERMDRLKTEFLASMSHELRTPLHTILGFTELLQDEKDGSLSAPQKRFLNHIQGDSQHLLQLINQVLDLSKIEAGQFDLKRETYPIVQSIREVHDAIRPGAESKGLHLEDRDQHFRQVLPDRHNHARDPGGHGTGTAHHPPAGRASRGLDRGQERAGRGQPVYFCVADCRFFVAGGVSRSTPRFPTVAGSVTAIRHGCRVAHAKVRHASKLRLRNGQIMNGLSSKRMPAFLA
jgi:hypothetical protein